MFKPEAFQYLKELSYRKTDVFKTVSLNEFQYLKELSYRKTKALENDATSYFST